MVGIRNRLEPDGAVMPSPTLDGDLGFLQGAEDLAVERRFAELRVEALAIAVSRGPPGSIAFMANAAMSALELRRRMLERPRWALCSRHPNFVNDCFGESETDLGTTRLGRKQRFKQRHF
jgi:hypothetical protein